MARSVDGETLADIARTFNVSRSTRFVGRSHHSSRTPDAFAGVRANQVTLEFGEAAELGEQ
jgi:hypothetical protein